VKEEDNVHLSHTYVSQGSNSAFIEVARQRAENARLLHEARAEQRKRPAWTWRHVARLAAGSFSRKFMGVGTRISRPAAQARS